MKMLSMSGAAALEKLLDERAARHHSPSPVHWKTFCLNTQGAAIHREIREPDALVVAEMPKALERSSLQDFSCLAGPFPGEVIALFQCLLDDFHQPRRALMSLEKALSRFLPKVGPRSLSGGLPVKDPAGKVTHMTLGLVV